MPKDNVYKSIVRVAFCKALDSKGGQEYKILQELCNTVYTLLPQEAALWETLADDVLNDPNRYKPERIDSEDSEDDDDDEPLIVLPEEGIAEDPIEEEEEEPKRRRKKGEDDE